MMYFTSRNHQSITLARKTYLILMLEDDLELSGTSTVAPCAKTETLQCDFLVDLSGHLPRISVFQK